MPEDHQKYLEWNGNRFRKWAERIGINTYTVVNAILTSKLVEQQTYRSCMGLLKLKLTDKYSEAMLEAACQKALSYTTSPSYKSIKNILVTGSVKTEPESSGFKTTHKAHGITRGADYYRRELIIMLPPSLIKYDHELLLKYMTSVLLEKYDVGCCAALHHNKSKTNLHIHLIFSEREIRQEVERKIASRNMFYNESGKHVQTKKEILDENGNVRPECKIIKKGEVYETNFFQPKKEEFKTNAFLENMKQVMTDAINGIVKDENEKLQVFQKDSPYLATKKIGKNNPKEAEIKADNYLRQEWNRNVDRALLTGASEAEVMAAKQLQIDVPVAESLREHGQDPRLFTGILQKAIGYLRGFVEFLRETKYCDRDLKGNPLIDHDVRIDITPEPLPAKPKGERPSSEKQEAEVMRLQQILNKMKKQEQKIYSIEKAIVKLEKDLKEVKKKWFHKKEQKELEGKIDAKKAQLEKAKDTLDLIPDQHGYQNALEVTKAMKLAKAELKKVQIAQKAWDAPEPQPEKMYLRIPANVSNMRTPDVQKSTRQKRSIHERLEEKKQIVEQQTKRKQRSGMEL